MDHEECERLVTNVHIDWYGIYIRLWFTPFILWVYYALMSSFPKSYIYDIFISTKTVPNQNILEYVLHIYVSNFLSSLLSF